MLSDTAWQTSGAVSVIAWAIVALSMISSAPGDPDRHPRPLDAWTASGRTRSARISRTAARSALITVSPSPV
jgi:hypothetical protein